MFKKIGEPVGRVQLSCIPDTQYKYFFIHSFTVAAFITTACLTRTYAIIFGSDKYELTRAQARISSQLIGFITCRSSRIHLSNDQTVLEQ